MANTVACSIVGPRIDYCNSLFYGASEKYLDKLQRLQNILARIATKTGLRDYHSVDRLRELHWLPNRSRISYKVAILCRRALNDGQPTYLASKSFHIDRPNNCDHLPEICSNNHHAEQRLVRVDSSVCA